MPADPNCVHCEGTGWKHVQRGELTAVERCNCFTAAQRASQQDPALGVPKHFREASFENFSCRVPGDPNEYDRLSGALIAAKRYAEDYPFAKPRGLFLQGPPGTGKTHLAVAAMRKLQEKGFEVVFFDYQTLLQRIRDSFNPAAETRDKDVLRLAKESEVLVLDDLGAHRESDFVFDAVTGIITHRYNEDLALIATTNLPMAELGDKPILRDPVSGKRDIRDTLADRIGERAVSRIFEMCVRIRLDVRDYRKRPETDPRRR
ncbi:MAG: AAA domain-containing protein [Acidobacteria bacterium]|nr:AAA domain-containing protein [Acidobacteriota bacterium]